MTPRELAEKITEILGYSIPDENFDRIILSLRAHDDELIERICEIIHMKYPAKESILLEFVRQLKSGGGK